MPKKYRKSDNCLNCGTPIKDHNYCYQCGQINTHKQVSLTEILKDLLGDYFTFDSKFFKSFVPLIKMPGHLTNEYVTGRRHSYILPMRLFIFTSALFFFVFSISSETISSGSFLNEKPVYLPADSLELVFEKYENQISPEVKYGILGELDDKYNFVFKDSSDIERERDSVRILIKNLGPEVPVAEREEFIGKLFGNFNIYKAELRSKDYEEYKKGIDKLDPYVNNEIKKVLKTEEAILEFINQYPALKEVNVENRLVKSLYSKYFITKIKNSNIRIMYSDVDEDTTQTGFFHKINENAKRLSRSNNSTSVFSREALNNLPKLVFLLLPMFALILKLVYVRSKIYYINHLVFALHIHTVFFIFALLPLFWTEWYTIALTAVLIWAYYYRALMNVYRQGWFKTFIKMHLILGLYFIPLIGGIVGLTLYTLYNI